MKNLLYKEFKLASHPTTYIFLSFSLMFLIPNYPSYIQFLYICMSIFFIFLNGRINQDVFYTVSLPIRKSDVVKARVLMIAIIQLFQVIIAIPIALLSIRMYPEGNLAGIDPNVAFFGFVFIVFSAFNIGFLPLFYRTGYKTGIPFLVGGIASILAYVCLEMLVWIPSNMQR
ncbi:MAG: ABC-2 transporter permease, partial [Candidatus Izemoplasmatales bacterium]|nr:ABC-2 transporter permease [Candidatus Izemoplasmatales bacterium]